MRPRIRLSIICAVQALLLSTVLHGQSHEVIKVSSDSLVNYMRKNITPEIYFAKDGKDVASFSIRGEGEAFLTEALQELQNAGYAVNRYDGKIIISAAPGLMVGLVGTFFLKENNALTDDSSKKFVDETNETATFQNKIYEIGDKFNIKKGKAVVRGYVRDVSGGEPIPGVSVYDANGSYTVTDKYGAYQLQLTPGDNVLGFSGYSLDDVSLTVKVYNDGNLDVRMKEKVTALKGAVVTAGSVSHHKDAKMGIEKIQMNTIRKIPTAFGEADVLRAVMALPGVKSSGEASTGFSVRGGALDQNLILFNDGTIYGPTHMFGVMSAFNPDIISNVDLYKSSIPAEFGGRISSVLDIRTKEGNDSKVSGTLGIGLLTSNFSLQGPIRKGKTTFVLGGRTTYSDWMLGLLPKDSAYSGGNAGFSDLNASLNHKFNDKNRLNAYAYWSLDHFGFSGDTTFRYSNLNASVKFQSQLDERNTMTVSTGYDSYDNEIDDTHYDMTAYSLTTDIREAFLRWGVKSLLLSRHTLSYGLDATMYMLTPGKISPLGGASAKTGWSLDDERALQPSLYLSDSWNVTDKIALDLGIRGSAFRRLTGTGTYATPELRASAKYSPSDNFTVKAGFNSMAQYIHLISNTSSISPMDTWRLCSGELKPQRGWQGAGGLYWTVAENKIDLSLEAYYKKMRDYPDYKSGATLAMNPNLADDLTGTYGKAYGVEFMARKALGKLNGWVSYTYSRSLLREMEDRGPATINGGEWYNAPHDKPHDFKLVTNYQLTHRYSFSVNLDYSTGAPVTFPTGYYIYAGAQRLAYSLRNEYRIPDYFRMDVALIVEPGHYLRKLTHMSFTLGVYNVTGRHNAYSVYYSSELGLQGYMISVFATRIPYINLNLKF